MQSNISVRCLPVRTQVRAGKIAINRCEELAASALIVRSAVRGGKLSANRCEALAG